MIEAKTVFYSMDESHHIQLDYIKQLLESNIDKQIINKHELLEVKEDLEKDICNYSNDTYIDMIIKAILNYTENEAEKEVLRKTFVMVDTKEKGINARAYPAYHDKSYFVQIGKLMYKDICNLSDVLASIVLILFHCKNEEEIKFGHHVLVLNLLKLDDSNDSLQRRIDAVCYNYNDETFIDKYIEISREAFEVAIAFLAGHEIGHHYYNHTSIDIKRTLENESIGGEIKSPEDPRIDELCADRFAVGFAYQYLMAMHDHTNIQQGCGMYVPLLVSALKNNPVTTHPKHPSILLRLLRLRDNMSKIFDPKINNQIIGIISEVCDALTCAGKDYSWWHKKWMINNGIPTEK